MSNNSYDVIVIGGGSDSLTTAALRAKAGKRILILETNAADRYLAGKK